jgi:hypothetical protein
MIIHCWMKALKHGTSKCINHNTVGVSVNSVTILTRYQWRGWLVRSSVFQVLKDKRLTAIIIWSIMRIIDLIGCIKLILHYSRIQNDDHHHANGVRLCLWTEATKPIVHPPDDIWAWRTMVDDVNWGKVPIHPPGCSPAIPPAQPSSSKSGGSEQRKLWMSTKHFFPICSSLACCKILWHGVSGFTSHLTEGVLQIFIALKTYNVSAGFEPANLGSNGKHTDHYTTEVTCLQTYMLAIKEPNSCYCNNHVQESNISL